MPPETIAALSAGPGGARLAVWSHNAQALAAFLIVQTQWRVVSIGRGVRYVGLDYGAVVKALEISEIAITPDLMSRLRRIEHGALEALNGARPESDQ